MEGTSLSPKSPEDGEVSDIVKFFNGRSVFITGGAGFVGSVLVESILRCCPGVQFVYILLREKKGASVESRKSAIFEKMIFQSLRSQSSKVFEKVRAVEGDITSTNLGIQQSVLEEIQDHVSIVFHCAAVISFAKPLRVSIEQNSIGTENVVNFCRKLPQMAAFVYTSTAYSNCNTMDEIREEIYELAVPARNFLDVVKSNSSDDVLSELKDKCVPPWPNTYTMSKAIAEGFLNDEASDIPLAIVRPSIILGTWKGPLPGYAEEGAGLIDVSIGIGKGFIRVLYCDEEKYLDIVPVDGVANALITAAWSIGTKKMTTPLVINYAVSEFKPCTWGYFVMALFNMTLKFPLPKIYQSPFIVMRKHNMTYWASAVVNHYFPAICIDAILLLMKKKPRLTKLYRFYDYSLKHLGYFLTNEWHFKSDNLRQLLQLQNPKDAELFPINLDGYSIDCLTKDIRHGAPFYQWKIDTRSSKDRLNLAYRRYLLTTIIKWASIFWILMFIAYILSKSILRELVNGIL